MPKKTFSVGDRVVVEGYESEGTVQYFGPHMTKTDGKDLTRVGVELDKPVGKNNGTVQGHAYFDTADNCGVFVQVRKVRLVGATGHAAPAGDAEKKKKKKKKKTTTKKTTVKKGGAGQMDSMKAQADASAATVAATAAAMVAAAADADYSALAGEEMYEVMDGVPKASLIADAPARPAKAAAAAGIRTGSTEPSSVAANEDYAKLGRLKMVKLCKERGLDYKGVASDTAALKRLLVASDLPDTTLGPTKANPLFGANEEENEEEEEEEEEGNTAIATHQVTKVSPLEAAASSGGGGGGDGGGTVGEEDELYGTMEHSSTAEADKKKQKEADAATAEAKAAEEAAAAATAAAAAAKEAAEAKAAEEAAAAAEAKTTKEAASVENDQSVPAGETFEGFGGGADDGAAAAPVATELEPPAEAEVAAEPEATRDRKALKRASKKEKKKAEEKKKRSTSKKETKAAAASAAADNNAAEPDGNDAATTAAAEIFEGFSGDIDSNGSSKRHNFLKKRYSGSSGASPPPPTTENDGKALEAEFARRRASALDIEAIIGASNDAAGSDDDAGVVDGADGAMVSHDGGMTYVPAQVGVVDFEGRGFRQALAVDPEEERRKRLDELRAEDAKLAAEQAAAAAADADAKHAELKRRASAVVVTDEAMREEQLKGLGAWERKLKIIAWNKEKKAKEEAAAAAAVEADRIDKLKKKSNFLNRWGGGRNDDAAHKHHLSDAEIAANKAKRSSIVFTGQAVPAQAPSPYAAAAAASKWVKKTVYLERSPQGYGFNLSRQNNSPVVKAVDPNGVARKAGATAGDLILEVNGNDTVGCPHFRTIEYIKATLPGRPLMLLLHKEVKPQQLGWQTPSLDQLQTSSGVV